MLKERVITAFLGGTLLLLLLYMGGYYSLAASLVLVVASFYEIARIRGMNAVQTAFSIATAILSFYLFTEAAPFYGVFLLLPILAFKSEDGKSNLYPFLFSCYVSFSFSRFYIFSKNEFSLLPIILLLATVWSHDTAAYFAGLRFGRRKILPRISPNKTLEGAIAGLIAGTVAFASAQLLAFPDANPVRAIIIGLVLSIAAFAGDLLESHYKRTYGVKDSGRLLPGHGGVLDRFDSLLAVLIVYSMIGS